MMTGIVLSCKPDKSNDIALETPDNKIKLMVLEPGHFHAALVQKSMYPDVDSMVHVFAANGAEFKAYEEKIQDYNGQAESPTAWKLETHLSDQALAQMIAEKPGNVVVLAGNNANKTEYILESIKTGLSVYSDKPMAINQADYELLKQAFDEAGKNDLLLYDIMTERFEITSMLQKSLAANEALFGSLVEGSPEKPAVTKESVHYFFKEVSGKPLVRPGWFYDVTQEGEGIVDVTTHLVDLIFWACFPDQPIQISDLAEISGKKWATNINKEQYQRSTKLDSFPSYLNGVLSADKNSINVDANGEILFKVKGHWAKASVIWDFEAPPGSKDTHYSEMNGTKASLNIAQGQAESFIPQLYVVTTNKAALDKALKSLTATYGDLASEPAGENKYKITIPEKWRNGHEAHFAQVTENFIKYYKDGNMPAWEVPNMLAKYYVTTQASAVATRK